MTRNYFQLLLSVEFFNNSDAILNFEYIAMHCGQSRVIPGNRYKQNIWERTVIFININNRQMLGITNKTEKTLGK